MEYILSEICDKINNTDETATHLYSTKRLSREFGEFLNLTDIEIVKLEKGAILHDVGKYKVSRKILYKKGRLTETEFEEMKEHVLKTKDVLDISKLDKDVVDIILQHHERPDGEGYPYGLKSDSINKLSKIFSLIDVFDALTTERVYKRALSLDVSLGIIKKGLGTQFDSKIGIEFIGFVRKNKVGKNKSNII